MKILFIFFLTFTVSNCAGDASKNELSNENVIVYTFKENTQCNNDGLTFKESSQKLINAGIDVLESYCGAKTGLYSISRCGAKTTDIIAHKIRSVNLSTANQVGYQDIESLTNKDKGTGYRIEKCPED
jgi:hypothetical protein